MRTDEQMTEDLKQLTEGLLFMSEADYPFQTVTLVDISPEHLRELAGKPADAPVETRSVEAFLRVAMSEPAWKGVQELAAAKKYQALAQYLKENLKDPLAYRVGAIDISVYLVGSSSTGKWVGLATRVVET